MYEQEQSHPIDPIDYLRSIKLQHPKNKGAHLGATELYNLPTVVNKFIEKGRPSHINENEWEQLCEKFLMEETNDEERAIIEQAWKNFVNTRHIKLAA
jgi:dTDP-glucose pyrophosphorylase